MSDKNIAYSERNITDILKRKDKYLRLKQFIMKQRKLFSFSPENSKNNFVLYPAIENENLLKNIIKRLDFSLPKKDNPYISIAINKKLKNKNLNIREDIKLIDEEFLKQEFKNSIILVHDIKSISFSILKHAHKIEIIDNQYFSDIEAETMRKIFFYSFDEKEKENFLELSKNNFQEFIKTNKNKNKAYCFTSGPSFDDYKKINIDKNSLKVVCNSIIKNEEFLKYIGSADILTFADPVFHFGPSEYAETFRKDVINFLERNEAYAIIPDYNLPLMLQHYPNLSNKLIGMPALNKDFNFPSIENFYVKGSANILTLFMIPIASTISNKIFLIGADGRKKEEKYFWKHSSSAQYDDKMESVFLTHPSFFRDRNYEDYYEQHCSFLENLISYGESLNKIYFSLTPSYIPVLKERFYEKNKTEDENIHNIKEIQYKNKSEILRKKENFEFAKKINILYKHIEYLKENNFKLALYGYGIIGKLIKDALEKQVIVISDKDINLAITLKNYCPPEKLNNHNFDKLVICVLGREQQIIDTLNIEPSKIYILDLNL